MKGNLLRQNPFLQSSHDDKVGGTVRVLNQFSRCREVVTEDKVFDLNLFRDHIDHIPKKAKDQPGDRSARRNPYNIRKGHMTDPVVPQHVGILGNL